MLIKFYFKTIYITILFLFISALGGSRILAENPGTPQLINFTQNKGQLTDQYYNPRPDILFSGNTKELAFYLRNNGISYQLQRVDSWKEMEIKTGKKIKIADRSTLYRIDLTWLNANTDVKIETEGDVPGYTNYYTAGCLQGIHFVKNYTGVTYKNIYENIDLHYYEKGGALKYDYIIQPHSDYKQIQIQISGAEEISLNPKGDLLIKTPLGILIEEAPIVYQKNKQLKAKWVIKNSILSFDIENYDAGLVLIIDPVVRVWGTYYGGTSDDIGLATSTDNSGNVYMAGSTLSNNNIVTSGSHQTVHAWSTDGFLSKFDAAGVRQWATYYGSAGHDEILCCATDVSGNCYVTGLSDSYGSFEISTANGHQPFFGGGLDAFLAKFNNAGIRIWATYYGGIDVDRGRYCATDFNGNIYLAGDTRSGTSTEIATGGGHQSMIAGDYDTFLAKFDSGGTRLWGTYYGGLGPDYTQFVSTDSQGNVLLSGRTSSSTTGISSIGSHQGTYGGGTSDGFLAKFNSNGIRQWGSYYGGSGTDNTSSCIADQSGNVFITGSSNSANAIATSGTYQSTLKGTNDGYLAKFDSNGARLWATYYGGLNADYISSASMDLQGNIYVTGNTFSSDASSISTPNSFQTALIGTSNAFISKFSSSGVFLSGTYYGGGQIANTYGVGCSFDNSNNSIYVTGYTECQDSSKIASLACHQQSFGGGSFDAFLAKFKDDPTVGLKEETKSIEHLYSVYPNPGSGIFKITHSENLRGPISINVYTSIGKLILSKKNISNELEINLEDYPDGLYFFTFQNDREKSVLKVLKK